MRFRRLPSGAIELSGIHPLFSALLADLPQSAARHERAQRRLYPDPVGADGDDTLRGDWNEHVRPGLERLFASSREIVAGDLAAIGKNALLVIPRDHIDAWLNALNQARLIIVEENCFGEADLDHNETPDHSTKRGTSLLKVHFYAHIQELLVEALG